MTAALCAIFFASGAAALVFETLWFHQAGLAFGNGVWASSIVLSSFMAGLALGNALVARIGDRLRRPLLVYAGLEIAIAATGVGLVWLLPASVRLLNPLLHPIFEQPWLANPVRLAAGFALLSVPTTAMGATLPILVRALLARDASFGSALGRLYGWNTLGAVLGAVASEAFLLERFGVRGSALCAGALDLAVAAGAGLLAGRFAGAGAGAPAVPGAARAAAAPGEHEALPSPARRLLAATALAGGVLLALEVVWFRFLQLFFHATSAIFALMLAVVLSGIALGSLLAGAWLRRRPTAYRGAAFAAALSAASLPLLYRGFSLVPFPPSYTLPWSGVVWRSALLMLPVSLLSGVLFTWIGSALRARLEPDARAAGLLTLANTLGSAAGSLLAGFVLLPALGMERSFFALGVAYLGVMALVAGEVGAGPARVGRRRALQAAGALAALSLALHPFGWMRSRYLTLPQRRWDPAAEVAAVREGRTETILYLRTMQLGQPLSYRLVTDGYSMSGTGPAIRRYMKLYVYLPVALRPDLRRALLISYGVGSTAKALTDTASLEQIDVVDLSREILELADVVYPDPASAPLNDPRVRVHVDDGRYFLQMTDERYDLITSEPPPPKNAGIVNLYTREYFQLIHDRLAEGGINTYWLPVHNLLVSDTKAILRAYCDVFPDCTLWAATAMDWMLVGSRGGNAAPTREAFERQWRDPRVVAELHAVGIDGPESLGALFMGDAAWIDTLTRGVAPLVDDWPKRLSNDDPALREEWQTYRGWVDAAAARERFTQSAWVARSWPADLVAPTLPRFETRADLVTRLAPGFEELTPERRFAALDRLLDGGAEPGAALLMLGSSEDEVRIARAAPEALRREPEALRGQALGALVDGDADRAVLLLTRLYRKQHDLSSLHLLAFALARSGRPEDAARIARGAAGGLPDTPEERAFWAWLEQAHGAKSPLAASGR